MTLVRKKDRKDPTPDEIARIEDQAKEAEKVWQEYLKHKDEKPAWMPGPEASEKEWLEYQAYTIPFKYQQMIEILEQQANSLSDFAYNVYDDDPKNRQKWLKDAEGFRQQAQEMREKWWIYRAAADQAKKELRRKY